MKEDGMDPSKVTVWEDDFKREWMGRQSVEGRDCAHVSLYASEDALPHAPVRRRQGA